MKNHLKINCKKMIKYRIKKITNNNLKKKIYEFFLPSCRSWWAGRALPRRCIPSLYPHPFFHRLRKKSFPTHKTVEKVSQPSYEILRHKNQHRLFQRGAELQHPEGKVQSKTTAERENSFKKAQVKSRSDRERERERKSIQADSLSPKPGSN